METKTRWVRVYVDGYLEIEVRAGSEDEMIGAAQDAFADGDFDPDNLALDEVGDPMIMPEDWRP